MKKVSVFMITYNHAPFIAQAIESIVTQQVNFEFELVIGEDKSTDNTLAICQEYAAKYPGIIRLLPTDRNYGVMGNTVRVLEACKGTYIATCEGDDYWCDENKLQKQVDFLDANPDYSMCFTAIGVLDEMGWNLPDEYYFPKPEKEDYTIGDFIVSEMNIVPTPTLMFRNVLPHPLPDFFVNSMAGDMVIQLFTGDKGKAKLINEKMAVYRNHSGGVTKSKETIEKANAALMKMYSGFNKYTNYKYDEFFRTRFLNTAKMHLIFGAKDKKGFARLRHYFRRMPDYIKYSKGINLKELVYYHIVLFFPFLLKIAKKGKA